MDSQGRKVVVCDNGTGVSASRGGCSGHRLGQGMSEGRAGPWRPGLHPGAKGPGSRFPPPWVWRARGSGPLVSPSPPLPQLGVRTAGEAGTGWGSHLLPGRGRPHAGAVGFWLKGRRGKRLGLCVPKGLHSPGSPVCKKEKDQEAFLFLYS